MFSKHINKKYKLREGKNEFKCEVEKFPLKPGSYNIEIYVGDGHTIYDYYDQGLNLEVLPSNLFDHAIIPDNSQGHFVVEHKWQ